MDKEKNPNLENILYQYEKWHAKGKLFWKGQATLFAFSWKVWVTRSNQGMSQWKKAFLKLHLKFYTSMDLWKLCYSSLSNLMWKKSNGN